MLAALARAAVASNNKAALRPALAGRLIPLEDAAPTCDPIRVLLETASTIGFRPGYFDAPPEAPAAPQRAALLAWLHEHVSDEARRVFVLRACDGLDDLAAATDAEDVLSLDTWPALARARFLRALAALRGEEPADEEDEAAPPEVELDAESDAEEEAADAEEEEDDDDEEEEDEALAAALAASRRSLAEEDQRRLRAVAAASLGAVEATPVPEGVPEGYDAAAAVEALSVGPLPELPRSSSLQRVAASDALDEASVPEASPDEAPLEALAAAAGRLAEAAERHVEDHRTADPRALAEATESLEAAMEASIPQKRPRPKQRRPSHRRPSPRPSQSQRPSRRRRLPWS